MTLPAAFLWLQAGPAEPSPFGMLVPMLLIFVIFYLLLIRPQQKRQREQGLVEDPHGGEEAGAPAV